MSIAPLFAMCVPPDLLTQLIEKAVEGQKKSYAPYSHYFVGAAVLTKSGKIYSGCNVENASYGLCNCAERTAVFIPNVIQKSTETFYADRFL
jgi:homotetrameric cytidine deaminase